jgi:hypothetical protein
MLTATLLRVEAWELVRVQFVHERKRLMRTMRTEMVSTGRQNGNELDEMAHVLHDVMTTGLGNSWRKSV